MSTPPTYWDYLRLDELLNLQTGLEGDEAAITNDELHFIVVHQAYELWFKLVLRELRAARDRLAAPYVPDDTIPAVVQHLRRVNEILKLAVDQFAVVETLTPQGFLAFRDKLVPASGFQSFQLRELEILLGLEESKRIRYGGADTFEHIHALVNTEAGQRAWARIEAARKETTLLRALQDWLFRTPIQGSSPSDAADGMVVHQFLEDYLRANDAHQHRSFASLATGLGIDEAGMKARFDATRAATRTFLMADDVVGSERARVRRVRAAAVFIESYRSAPLLAWPRLLLDLVLELEEQVVLFRHRHARMVERVIGRRVGTGGSGGVEYLDKTVAYRVFNDLWTIRTVLLPADEVPPLKRPERYGFA
jgi:tryptophan 2,3-dioxygenase